MVFDKIPLTKLRFRFLEKEDVAQYGGDWFLLDEKAITRQKARNLIAIEKTIGMSILHMMLKYRIEDVEARLAGMWVARRLSGVVEDYEKFNPIALAVDWELVKDEKAPEVDVDPPASESSTGDQ